MSKVATDRARVWAGMLLFTASAPRIIPLICLRLLLTFLLYSGSMTLLAMGQRAAAQTQASGSREDAQVTSSVLLLEDVIREALDKNPEVRASLHAVKAMGRRVPQVKTLPDPMISVGWAGNVAPFSVQQGDPSSYRGLTLSEQFPAPGKLKLRGQVASKDVDAAQADYEAVRRRLTVEVKSAYFEYFYIDKAIQTTQRNEELLQKLSQVSEARYRIGKAMQQDVLRSQVEISVLLQKRTILEQQRATAQARINTYLLRDPESPLPPTAELQTATIRYSLSDLYALATAHDVAVIKSDSMVDKSRLGIALAQREYTPDVGVSYMYQQRPGLADMNGLTVTVNVPVFYRSKQRQAVAEMAENLLSAEKGRDNRLNEVRFELRQQYLAANASRKLMELYTKAVVPQSSLALESSMSSYEVGTVDFLSLLANFTTLWSFETDYYRQLADYETALARIEALTGTDISGPPIETPTFAAPKNEKQ